MKDRNYNIFIEDILEAMEKIGSYIKEISFEAFEANDMIVDAVIRNLGIIGEASAQIPTDIKEKFPDIPWKRMIGLRNIVIHEYFGIDLDTIWQIVTKNIPDTKPQIGMVLRQLNEKSS